jgi:hypothetical protein
MADRFLAALVKLAARAPDLSARIAIPAGRVDVDELARVVCALGLVDRNRGAP